MDQYYNIYCVGLHFDGSLDDLPALNPTERASTFVLDTSTYGKLLLQKNDQGLGIIDLGKSMLTTGVLLRPSQGEVFGNPKVSVSEDGKTWTDIIINPSSSEWLEYPVTQIVSGALIPGRKIQFIRIDGVDEKQKMPKIQISIYGKENYALSLHTTIFKCIFG